ncbi:MAG TPA: hypothetical protein HPQ04_03150 [Rhodospirillaceae bacterium]|nr:hypothetical protein [Rhodospirillaceae bacterium]
MYNDDDLEAAVAAGVLGADAVSRFRQFMEQRRAPSSADDENFRLTTSFNDIFVAIATLLILVAVGWLGRRVDPALGDLAVVAVAWGLAEYFTRVRGMALPSILLLLGFVGGAFATGIDVMDGGFLPTGDWSLQIRYGLSAALAAAAAFAHWRRFMVPITVAAGTAAAITTISGLLLGFVPALRDFVMPLILAGGLTVFAVAMHWDMGDRKRTTRRADVAFWLHLSSAPLLVHPVFAMLGISVGGGSDISHAGVAVAMYCALAFVALAVDRRALLVSALFYVLYAMTALFQVAGSSSASFAFTALVIGSALLLLSAFWRHARRLVIGLLPPGLTARLPVI